MPKPKSTILPTDHPAVRQIKPDELEGLALRVAQARSALVILLEDHEGMSTDLHNALALLDTWLDSCAEDLSDLHRRHESLSKEGRP
jgi:hypothetical protein